MSKGKAETANAGSNAVDAYMEPLPADARAALQRLRRTIKAAAPEATEGISYQIPTFKHHGMLLSFAAFKGHCSLFPASKAVMAAFQDELAAFDTSSTKATIRFQASRPLPAALVRKIVRARVRENEARRKR